MQERTVDDLQRELREALLPWVLVPLALVGMALTVRDPESLPPPSTSALGLGIMGAAIIVWALKGRKPAIAAWIMVAFMLLTVSVAWLWFPQSQVYYLVIIPVAAASLTLGRSACLTVSLASSALVIVGPSPGSGLGLRGDPSTLAILLGALWGLAIMLCAAQRSQRTLISWSWQGYTEARRHLEVARDRQAELKQVLEDLALANRETIRLNEMLSAARRALEEARRAKEEFVANVSHELRTPLNMIIGFSDMILDTPETYAHRLPGPLLADVAAIRRNSEHLSELVDDVLDLSEADGGSMQILKEQTSFYGIAEEAQDTVMGLFVKKGLTLELDVPEELPPLYCDRTRIRQVLLNLLSNAARFTEHGGAWVRASVTGHLLTVSVSDSGPGMAPETLDRLFEPFQQGDPSIRRRYGGSGLGLAISKRLVEMHGGRIWIESKLGLGTTVSFALPLGDAALALAGGQRWFGDEPYEPRARSVQLPPLHTRPRVVVVEKGTALLRLLERFAQGLEPVAAPTVEEAAHVVEAQSASALVINDASGEGADVLGRLSRTAFSVPIFSCWVPEREASLDRLGAQDYLVKPVGRQALFEAIERVAPGAKTIVLADDDAEARRLFGRMLASAERDYVVLPARDGGRALELMHERSPDLLLLDLVMPQASIDGFEVLRVLARDPELTATPVIILSAKDPEREPLVSRSMMLSRQEGLSPRDLADALQAIVQSLKPRFGAGAS